MAKLELDNIAAGLASTGKINSNNDLLETHLNDNVLYRDNPTGEANQMEQELDMNNYKIINSGQATQGTDLVTLAQLNGAISSGSSGLIAQQRETVLGSEAVNDILTLTGITYIPSTNNLSVYRNGQRLESGADYSESGTTNITLTFTPNSGDRFVFLTNESVDGVTEAPQSINVLYERIVATAGQTVFTIANSYITGTNAITVFVNGSLQTISEYAETSSAVITFSSPLTAGDNVDVYVGQSLVSSPISSTSVIHTPPDGSQTTVATYLNNRHIINVKDFGAVGDGVTDDFPAFTAAKTYIENLATRPELVVPAGTYYIDGALSIDFIMRGEGSRNSVLLFDNTSAGYALTVGAATVTDFNKGLIGIGLEDPSTNSILHGILFRHCVQGHAVVKDVFVQQYDEATSKSFSFENCQDITFENLSSLGGNRGLDLDPASGSNTNLTFINFDGQNDAEWGVYATSANCEQITFIGGVIQDVADGQLVNLDSVDNFGFVGTWFETTFATHKEVVANNCANLNFTNAHFTSNGAEVLIKGTTNASFNGCYFQPQIAGTGGSIRLEDTAMATVLGCSPEVNAVDVGTTVIAIGHDLTVNDLEPGSGVYHSFNQAGNIYLGTRSGIEPEDATTEAASGIKIEPLGQVQAAAYQDTPLVANRVSNEGVILDLRKDGTTHGGVYAGTGTPEAAVVAPVGSLFLRSDGGASTTLYIKETGTGNTGWVAK
jgi:hypothetical protein